MPGRIAESALRGGLYSAIGTGGRELAQGQDLDPRAIATSAGIGAVTGGGLARLLGPATAGAPAVNAAPTGVSRLLSPRGEEVATREYPLGKTVLPAVTPSQIQETLETRLSKRLPTTGAYEEALPDVDQAITEATQIGKMHRSRNVAASTQIIRDEIAAAKAQESVNQSLAKAKTTHETARDLQ